MPVVSTTAEIVRTSNPLIVAQLRHSLTPAQVPPDPLGLPVEIVDPPLLSGVEADLAALLGIASAFDSAADAAADDRNLSPQGRADATGKAARVANEKLDAFATTTIGGIAKRVGALEKILTPETPAVRNVADAIVAELRAREIRDQVRSRDPIERDLVFRGEADEEVKQALAEGPMTAFQARRGGPLVFTPFISEEAKADWIARALEARQPEAARELKDLRSIRRTYEGQVATIRRAIREVVG